MCSKKKILWVESRDLSQTDNSYNSVFFSKVEWWVVELFFVSLNNWGLNFLQNEFSQSSQIYLSQEKLRKMFTFSILKWLFAELSKMTTIFTQNSPWMSFEWKVVSFCEFAQLCKQLFLSKLEKNHVTQLTGFSSQNTKWGPQWAIACYIQKVGFKIAILHYEIHHFLIKAWKPALVYPTFYNQKRFKNNFLLFQALAMMYKKV